MARRSAWAIAVLGIVATMGAPAAKAGVSTCPTGVLPASGFASANLGTNATTCGNVSAAGNSVTTAVPTGAPGFDVETWLGTSLDLPGFSGQSASALQFSNFLATQGSIVNFNWTASFEQFSEGYAFALLDGQLTVLQQQINSATITNGSLLDIQPLTSAQLGITADGFHTLALGIVQGCSSCLGLGANTLDPGASFFDIFLDINDAAAAPEPTTLSLMGLGLAGVILGASRRKKR